MSFIETEMKTKLIHRTFIVALLAVLIAVPANFQAAAIPSAAPQPNIGVNGYYANNKAQRGRTMQAAIVMDIPG